MIIAKIFSPRWLILAGVLALCRSMKDRDGPFFSMLHCLHRCETASSSLRFSDETWEMDGF